MAINFHWMQRIHWPCDSEGLRQMAQELEAAGIESVLLPYGPDGEDFSMYLADIFRETKKIRMMLALGAYAVTPEYASKTFFTAQKFGPNRLDLNLVAGRYDDFFAQMAFDYYPGDISIIDTHEKRVALTEKWMEKFYKKIKNEQYTARLAVVGSSDTTINIANTYTDYIIINNFDNLHKITNSKPILVIDPLILEEGQDESSVEYEDYKFTKKNHSFVGTYEEVVLHLKNISDYHNINDFIVHTDQKDISKLLKLIKEMTENNG